MGKRCAWWGWCVALAATFTGFLAAGEGGKASFAEFDRRAKAGEKLSVVFLGGSLTWSANATEPNVTGFRGLMARHLTEKYPQAHFSFHDAAIGGTGSMLAMFRLDRDVFAHKPDLVFLDFSCNDGCDTVELAPTCCYEHILRRLIGAGIPVTQMFFSFQFFWQEGKTYDECMPRRALYQRLAKAYNTPVGDSEPEVNAALAQGKKLTDVWPIDAAHPGDYGYSLFAEAGKKAFDAAVAAGSVCVVPETPVFGDVINLRRLRIADGDLPAPWKRTLTYRTSAWYDGLTSRWMDDVACFSGDKATPLEFAAGSSNFIAFFGEGDPEALSYELAVDGKKVETFSPRLGFGRLFAFRTWLDPEWQTQRDFLAPRRVTVTPVPDPKAPKGELRLESLMTATIVPVAPAAAPAAAGDSQKKLDALDHGRGKAAE